MFNILKKKIEKYRGRQIAKTIALDKNYYRKKYSDLANLNDEMLYEHWIRSGYFEGRIPSQSLETHQQSLETHQQSLESPRWINYFNDEKIYFTVNFGVFLKEKKIPEYIFPNDFRINEALNINSNRELNVQLDTLIDCILGNSNIPVSLVNEPKINSEIYLNLAKKFFSDKLKFEQLLLISIHFFENPHSIELLGNIAFDKKDYFLAESLYQSVIQQNSNPNEWLYANYSETLLRREKYLDALANITNGLLKLQHRLLSSKHDEIVNAYFENAFNKCNQLISINQIKKANLEIDQSISEIYQSYLSLKLIDCEQVVRTINKNRILIIGDFGISQCKRYRIDQKIEQLKSQNIRVEAINFDEIKNESVKIALNDIVIFYRVRATNQIINTIADVNARGSLSIFELDDLLFIEEYPHAIENYGGLLGIKQHNNLKSDRMMFRAAATLCQTAISSTIPLQEELSTIVKNGRCILHRNGIDSHHRKLQTSKQNTNNDIRIFYGSGTKSHNSDFINEALPSIIRVLNEHANVKLVIAGYLSLPENFLSDYKKQIEIHPFTADLNEYYNILGNSDINLATLTSDKLTDAKSEIKWIESALLKIPSIVSGTKNYKDVISNYKNGLIANNKDDWYTHLKKLIEDKPFRMSIAKSAYDKVIREYNVKKLGKGLVSSLEKEIETLEQKNTIKKRKKIVIVNVFFAPQTIGGATRVVEDNIDDLLESYSEEYEISVFTSNNDNLTPYVMDRYRVKNVNVFRISPLFKENMDWEYESSEMFRIFADFLDYIQPDLVHFHCIQRLTASVVDATKFLNIPYFVTVHDAWWISNYQFLTDNEGNVYEDGHPDIDSKYPTPSNISWEQSLKRRTHLNGLLNSATKVFAVSNSFAEIYKKNKVRNILSTKNGISSKIKWEKKDTNSNTKLICAHIGGMSHHKGYFRLKEALLKCNPKNLEFIMVDHSKNNGYFSKESWGNVVINIIGKFPQEEINEFFKKVDVLFAPSIWPESFGLVTREANASGCWVVTSNVGAIGEDINHNNGFVISPTIDEISNVIRKLDQFPQKYKSIAKVEVPFFSKNQLDLIVNHYETLFKNE